ncbi:MULTISPECIES: VIT1/CCC1 transporter family protein [Aliiglaciecola]|uniref:VIT1/CCC1 transporter family protein n=1 Tax=Aliiglaciecola TaxID=1406885 RepID=UPI001C08CCC1|nr:MULTISPECIES: VIT family protein [Aliiglaciecola]MBU2876796.1 VIT family protein [Aliiglaciecola lipolytica]MDO6711899.1 VIT family protein [Aliiglaciecola sp. 2_MG-2023]MDO6753127.1 VIT family protein [Aliiglaciecola sp. 1_MG-2023]
MDYNHEHKADRIGWIRAVVLGANDGIVSTASLIVGIAASQVAPEHLFIVGLAALVAGAMSMAAGEFVSVSSQTDIEHAEISLEQKHIDRNWAAEEQELANIYIERGLEDDLAMQVAKQLMAKDAIGSHVRDELGITEQSQGNPFQAALFSALSFTAGALLPLVTVLLVSGPLLIPSIVIVSLLSLVLLGSLSANIGGASILKGSLRVLIWGSLAMAVSIGVGYVFQVSG